jgi:hypothetical protein
MLAAGDHLQLRAHDKKHQVANGEFATTTELDRKQINCASMTSGHSPYPSAIPARVIVNADCDGFPVLPREHTTTVQIPPD